MSNATRCGPSWSGAQKTGTGRAFGDASVVRLTLVRSYRIGPCRFRRPGCRTLTAARPKPSLKFCVGRYGVGARWGTPLGNSELRSGSASSIRFVRVGVPARQILIRRTSRSGRRTAKRGASPFIPFSIPTWQLFLGQEAYSYGKEMVQSVCDRNGEQ
jgi:hypothetical protein